MGGDGPSCSDRDPQSWSYFSLHSYAWWMMFSRLERLKLICGLGNDYTNAGQFATDSAPALSKVTNLDGSTTNLIYDVHKYLDSDNSGTHSNCVTDGIDAAFAPLANYLRKNKRIALLSEIGGGHDDPSCLTSKSSQSIRDVILPSSLGSNIGE